MGYKMGYSKKCGVQKNRKVLKWESRKGKTPMTLTECYWKKSNAVFVVFMKKVSNLHFKVIKERKGFRYLAKKERWRYNRT